MAMMMKGWLPAGVLAMLLVSLSGGLIGGANSAVALETAADEPPAASEQATPELHILTGLQVNVGHEQRSGPENTTVADTEVVITASGGDVTCSEIRVWLVDLQHLMSATTFERSPTSGSISCTEGKVAMGEAERLELWLAFPNRNLSRAGTLIVQYGDGPAIAKDVPYRFQPKDRYLLLPLGIAGVFAIASSIVFITRTTKERRTADLKSVKGWTFKNSWASNIAVLGGLAATLLATTPVFERLRFVSAEQFAAGNLIFTAVVLVSPLIIGMTISSQSDRKEDTVSVRGFAASAILSTAAVVGQLAMFIGPISESNISVGSQVLLFLAAFVASVVVASHGYRLFQSRVNAPAPQASADASWSDFFEGVLGGPDMDAATSDEERREILKEHFEAKVRGVN